MREENYSVLEHKIRPLTIPYTYGSFRKVYHKTSISKCGLNRRRKNAIYLKQKVYRRVRKANCG